MPFERAAATTILGGRIKAHNSLWPGCSLLARRLFDQRRQEPASHGKREKRRNNWPPIPRTIAAILARQKRLTGSGLTFTQGRVKSLRQTRGIAAYSPSQAPADGEGTIMSADQAARELAVNKSTVYRWLRDGFLVGEQLTPGAPWRIRIDAAARAKVRSEAPPGWLPLEAAAKVLGVARQTVLHRVQRGELNAVYVRCGRRKGLRIEVERNQVGLNAESE